MATIKIEICCGSYEDVMIAKNAGAHRVELNSALCVGGLTPTYGTVKLCKENISIPVMAMVRPRTGGFLYNEYEYETMKEDAAHFLALGVDGLVFGFLNADGTVDKKRTSDFVERAAGRETVFHRAFDLVADPFEALDTLISLGVTRILTSGLEKNALEGQQMIRQLIERANGQIQILPGSGIKPDNVKQLITHTAVQQVHLSAATITTDPTILRNDKISFCSVNTEEHLVSVTSAEVVGAVVHACADIGSK